MARMRTYGNLTASPGGRSFYSTPRKRTRKARAPITPALRALLTKQREERQIGYQSALRGARDAVHQQALQLRETFGGHSTEYYAQEILQRARLERGRRGPSRWNAFLRQELKMRNAGMPRTVVLCVSTQTKPPELPAGQRKLKSTDVIGEVSKKWKMMDQETKTAITDPLMEELITSRDEADTGAKIVPVHILNDVSAIMAKVTREVCH